MAIIDRRSLLSAFGVASMAPLLTSARAPQSAAAASRQVAVVTPGGNRFPYSVAAVNTAAACKVTAEDSAGGCSAFELVTPSHGGPGLHVHHREDEWYYVLAGQFLFDVGDQRHELSVGASIFAPRDITHRWANSGTSDGRLILVCQPGGFEKFFDELAKIPLNPNDAAMKAMQELAKRFGMEMLGPPIFA